MRESRRVYEYLAVIEAVVRETGREGIRLTEISRRLGVKPSSAHEYVKRLVSTGYVVRRGRGVYRVSRRGLRALGERMWAHGVIETFLNRVLGIDPDTACMIASRIDYLVPLDAVERLCDLLGHPEVCPHNHRIPHRGLIERHGLTQCFLNNMRRGSRQL